MTPVTAGGGGVCYGALMKTTYDMPPAPLGPVARAVEAVLERLLAMLVALLARGR